MNSTRSFLLKTPKRVVHCCFLLVFILATTLTWREALILKDAYEINQRDELNTTSNAMERQWQRSLDELYFYRDMLRHAIRSPVENDHIRQELKLFQQQRTQPFWRLSENAQRSMPLNGVADDWMEKEPLLNRDDPERLNNELSAALEMSFILQLHNPSRSFHHRLWYISRSGFYLSSRPPHSDEEMMQSYHRMIHQPYFTGMTPEANPKRKNAWTDLYEGYHNEGKMVTGSIPVDFNGYWYGVLAMDFSEPTIVDFLRTARPKGMTGSVLLYNDDLQLIANTDRENTPGHILDTQELALLAKAREKADYGALRVGTRFVTWTQSNNSGALLVNIQNLGEGLKGETGRASVVLILMWMLFSLVLIFSHQIIIRLIGRMLALQNTLSWRANYDSLTRLLNRAAFFEKAAQLSEQSVKSGKPFSVIQLDLDRFKQVNDTYGHLAGDRVLIHAASTIKSTVRKQDHVGRVGGEEFCIVLPETTLEAAAQVAERVRAKLAKKEVLIGHHQTLKVTGSFGVSCSEEEGQHDFESLQSVADGRLYIAKESGRNQVCTQN